MGNPSLILFGLSAFAVGEPAFHEPYRLGVNKLPMPLDLSKELEGLSLETLCNDVVIGLMSLTLAK